MEQKLLTHEPDLLPYRVAKWVENNWPEVAQGAISLLFALASLGCSDEIAGLIAPVTYVKAAHVLALIMVVVLGVLQFLLLVANHRRTERMSDLRTENVALKASLKAKGEIRPLQVKPLIFAYLKQLGEHELDFGSRRGDAERLTLYLHDDNRPVFIPVGRFSNSPEFCEIARQEYPDDQGCLASVWVNGWHCAHDYPDPKSQSSAYVQRCLRDGMPEDVIAKLRMKSRLYCGSVIWNKQRNRQVGLLLLEATYDRYHANLMEAFMKKQEQGYLGELIYALRTL